MKKRRARIKLTLICVVVMLGIALTAVGFDIPGVYGGKTYSYNGFAESIKLGIDLKGGISAVYDATPDADSSGSFENDLDATIARIQEILTDEGYTEATVLKQGTDQIRVEVPDVDDPEAIFELIGEPKELLIRDEEDFDQTHYTSIDIDRGILTGDDIKSVRATVQNGVNGVLVEFTSEASDIFFQLTTALAESSGQIHMYLGKDSSEPFSSATVDEGIAGGTTFISGTMDNAEEAEAFAMQILSGTFNVNLDLSESAVISATLGEEALDLSIIAGLIGIVAVFIFMFIMYGTFGLIADLALTIYLIILMFFLQAVPFVQLTLPGIAGIILGLGMAVDANVIIFERIKDEYRLGKKIPVAIKSGFNKATSAILDANITTVISSVVLFILGTSAIKGFATTLLIGILVSLFTALVVTKSLIKIYLPLNTKNAKKYRLKREDNINELG